MGDGGGVGSGDGGSVGGATAMPSEEAVIRSDEGEGRAEGEGGWAVVLTSASWRCPVGSGNPDTASGAAEVSAASAASSS